MAAVANTAQLVPTYACSDGTTAANVLAFHSIGGDFDTASGDYILNAWLSFWKQMSNVHWLIDATALWKDLSVDPADELVAVCVPDAGDGSGDTLPSNCAWVISLHAGSGGRRGRGRIYVPGLGEGDADGSVLASAFISLALSEYAAFSLDIATNTGWVPAVYSRTDGVSRVIQSIDVDSTVDSQRRRAQRLAG